MQDIAADGVGDFDGGTGVGEFADVARRLEVVEDSCAEHVFSIAKRDGLAQAAFL